MRTEWDVPTRRACCVCLLDTSTYHYKSRRPGQAGLELRIREICQTRVRYGYRRVHIQLRREGWCHGQNKTRRIYRELGLQLRNKTPKRRVKAKLREDRRPATRSNETWRMDFVHDQLATGRKLRVLTIVDTFSRFSPALEPCFTFRGADVVEVLERVGRQVGLTGNGRNPMFNGRRQPSCGGTRRMNREVHVPFCERLGVKFPGPTRQMRRRNRGRSRVHFRSTPKADRVEL